MESNSETSRTRENDSSYKRTKQSQRYQRPSNQDFTYNPPDSSDTQQSHTNLHSNQQPSAELTYETTNLRIASLNASRYDRAKTLHQLKQDDKTLIDLNKIIELNPNEASFYANRGDIFYTLKQYDKALIDLNKIIELNPDDAFYYSDRAKTFHQLKRYDKALTDLNKAIELNPNEGVLYANRAKTFHKLGRYDEALNDYNKALRYYETEPEDHPDESSFYADRAKTFHKLGRYDEALNDYQMAITLLNLEDHPGKASSYADIAKTFHELGRYDEAVSSYNKALRYYETEELENHPDEASFYADIAKTFHKLGRYDKALSNYQMAIDLKPNESSFYADWAKTFYKLYDNNGDKTRRDLPTQNLGKTLSDIEQEKEALIRLNNKLIQHINNIDRDYINNTKNSQEYTIKIEKIENLKQILGKYTDLDIKENRENYNKSVEELKKETHSKSIIETEIQLFWKDQKHSIDMINNYCNVYDNRLRRMNSDITQGLSSLAFSILRKFDKKVTELKSIRPDNNDFFDSISENSELPPELNNKPHQIKKTRDYKNQLENYKKIYKNLTVTSGFFRLKNKFYRERLNKWITDIFPMKEDLTKKILGGKYSLTSKIGTGGNGTVYEATIVGQKNIKRAIKTIEIRNPEETQQLKTAFNQEFHLLSQLNHPNIPHVYDYFSINQHPYLVMNLIEGKTLKDYLLQTPEKKLPLHEVIEIAIQLCDVLDYLHNHKPPIIYRDLKPSNIMRHSNGHIYLIDFGTAGDLSKDTSTGTIGYAAPEQYEGSTTQRSDIYSLAATLHHLISGQNPSKSLFELPPPLNLAQYGPAGQNISALINQMLSQNPEKRPSKAKDIKEKFHSLKKNNPQLEIMHLAIPSTSETELTELTELTENNLSKLLSNLTRTDLNLRLP